MAVATAAATVRPVVIVRQAGTPRRVVTDRPGTARRRIALPLKPLLPTLVAVQTSGSRLPAPRYRDQYRRCRQLAAALLCSRRFRSSDCQAALRCPRTAA